MNFLRPSRCTAPLRSHKWLRVASQMRELRKLHPKDKRAKYDKKVDTADEIWREKANAIKEGRQESMLSILERRGFINAIAGDRDELDKWMTEERIGAYVGIDPTASSLHLGHLLPLMALLWMYVHGFEAVTLLGGATGQIGDPTGRLVSRQSADSTTRRANMAAMHIQIKKLWHKMEQHAIRRGFESEWAWRRGLYNNTEWLDKVTIYDFMRTLGSGIRVGPLLGRDTVKTKMEKGEGVSFAEFSYPLMQAWDWWHLLKARGVCMQIGGSDQFGNIVTGIDAVNHLKKQNFRSDIPLEYKKRPPLAFTVPLLTTSSGEKFGKSAGNAIWLDEDMTSPLELYQFLLRSADADIERYLRLFTLLPLEKVASLMTEHSSNASLRIPQRALASEMVTMIHGQGACERVEQQLAILYDSHATTRAAAAASTASGDVPAEADLDKKTPVTAENAPSTRAFLPRSAVVGRPFSHVMYAAGMSESRSAANRLISGGGAYVGSRPGGTEVGGMGNALKFAPMKLWGAEQTEKYLIDGSLLILRVGKWKVKVIEVLDDVEYYRRGLPTPLGQTSLETQSQRLFKDKEGARTSLKDGAADDQYPLLNRWSMGRS